MKKRVLCIMLAAVIAVSVFSVNAPSAKAAEYSGSFGSNLSWHVNTVSGVLTISNNDTVVPKRPEPIPNYWSGGAPWYKHNSEVTRVVINDGVTDIGNWAFADFSRVTAVEINDDQTRTDDDQKRIGVSAFSGCISFERFIVNGGGDKDLVSVTRIEENAFYNCRALRRLAVSSAGGVNVDYIGTNAFVGCASLSHIYVGGAGRYRSVDGAQGFVAEYYITSTASYPVRALKSSVNLPDNGTATTYTIPSTVTTIESEAFAYLKYIDNITVPAGAMTIRDRAFAYSHSLRTATFLGDAPTSFGADVFKETVGFEIVFFPHAQRWTTPTWQGYPSRVNNSRIILDKYVITLHAGETAELLATVLPSTAPQSVTWTSDNTGIAAAAGKDPMNPNDPVGVITAGANPGVTRVIATSTTPPGGGAANAAAVCEVIVLAKGVSANTVLLDKALLSVSMDNNANAETYQALEAVFRTDPGIGTQQRVDMAKELVWTSSDSSVAYVGTVDYGNYDYSVNPNIIAYQTRGVIQELLRVVIPLKAGTATITVRTPDGGSVATCVVTVTAAEAFIPVTNVELSPLTVSMGAVIDLSTKVLPEDATHETLTLSYIEADSTVKGAVLNGSVLTAPWNQTGTIIIEATVEKGRGDIDWGFTDDTSYTKRFTINAVSFIPVTNIINVPNKAFAGRPLQLTGTAIPEGAAYRDITWAIGTVNTANAFLDTKTGLLTPQNTGEVSIVATVRNGVTNGSVLQAFTQNFTVYVSPYTPHALTLRAGPGGGVGGTSSAQYGDGETVRITAAPSAGYVFWGWSSSGGGTFADPYNPSTDFTMPNNAVTVTAYFSYTGRPPSSVWEGAALPTPVHYFTYGSMYTKGSAVTFGHVSIRDIQLFRNVVLDGGTLVRNQHYSVAPLQGLTEINLANGYLDSLSTGQHTLEVIFSDYVTVTAVFTVISTAMVSQQYDDVNSGHWYYDYVEFVSERGWMTSGPNNPRMFLPSSHVTQGEVVDAVYHMAGSPAIIDLYGFPLQGRAAATEWVLANAVVPISGSFNMASPISRQDIVLLLGRFSDIMNYSYTATRAVTTFADDWQVSTIARPWVNVFYTTEIINGRAVGYFAPLGNMTRAEFAAVLCRFDAVMS